MPTSYDSALIEIMAADGNYPVEVAAGAFDALFDGDEGDRLVIVDAFLADRVSTRIGTVPPLVIVADETAKSLEKMTDLVVALRDRGATRGTTLVAVGGGVVQDAAAFAASVYMRGLAWIYVPTTLLSMTDSCIGGKSSINVGRYKNIVGTIHPPQRVVIDPTFAMTLSPEQVAAGLCEAAKICLCKDPETADGYLSLGPRVDMDASDLAKVIGLSLRAKKWFIEVDEFDRAERLVLNFGHTFGHALETASDFAVTHGIAVGLGMLAAIEMAQERHPHRLTRQVAAFRNHIHHLLQSVHGLAATLERVDLNRLMDAFDADKKHGRDFYAVIMPRPEGNIERVLLPRDEATRAMIERAAAAMLTPLWEREAA